MSYDNKEVDYESAPKKADVLIKSTQTIVDKQGELVEQTKLAISRIDEAIKLCHKNSEEASSILEHSTKMFDKLQAENSALKQELLYLAKQSENIYAGLAEKLNEMEQEACLKSGDSSKAEQGYFELSDKLAGLFDKITEISARIDALAADTARAGGTPVVDNSAILEKLDRMTDYMRKNESAHSMLADRFEILSMRVEQFGYGSKQPVYPQPAAPYPVPVQTAQPAEIDYDKLASKVAELLSVKDVISPDYIASKVAEQLVLPEQTGGEINTQKLAREVASLIDIRPAAAVTEGAATVQINEESLAEKIAEKIGTVVSDPASTSVQIDEESLAERIAEKLNIAADVASVEINEDALAEKIAEKLGAEADTEEAEPVAFDDEALVEKIVSRIDELNESIVSRIDELNVNGNIDQEDLADSIALKVGSLKPEDFEIIVDDAGCASLSKEIADKLDYNFITTLVADKLREALDIAAANAPDYEDMAERISEKITVAGINEDAIAEKAAAVLSNYLPEFDTDEIADKVTGAVIDVVSAIPHPTVDTDAICSEISERLMESQADTNYDIVIDDDGISKITAIVTEDIEKNALVRFDKLEESISKISEMLEPEEIVEDEEVAEEEDEVADEIVARLEKIEESVGKLAEMLQYEEVVEEEVEGEPVEQTAYEASDEITSRLDKIEESIGKLAEMLEYEEIIEDEPAATKAVDAGEEVTQEIVVDTGDIVDALSARFDKVEEEIAKIYDVVSNMVVDEGEEEYAEEEGEAADSEEYETAENEEYGDEELSEEDYQTISDMFSDLSTRFEVVEQKIDSLSELISVDETEGEEEYAESDEEEYAEESEEEYSEELDESELEKLSQTIVSRFDTVEQKINELSDIVSKTDNSDVADTAGEDDYLAISEVVATEIENCVAYRLDGIDEKLSQISAKLAGGVAVAGVAAVSGELAADGALYEQLDKISGEIKKISEYIEGDVPVIANERVDKIAGEVERISQLVEGELSIETAARLDKLHEEIENLSQKVGEGTDNGRLERVEGGVDEIKGMLSSGAIVTSSEESVAVQAVEEEVEEESEELVTVSEIVKPIQIEGEDTDGDFILSALDMDSFSDDERMPGELGDLDGVDFENMMKYNRSFIARIIQSDDDCKRYYGAVKHALLSYKKVNSNVAWSNERFNKGRETIARMKIRGKTLVIYLALDPNEYKTSVYHHADVSDNNSVPGTPMMIKVKSPLGVRKAIRLIDEMLEKRNGEKRDVPERDYAAMYPYETIEELIEDGLVKDVRKK